MKAEIETEMKVEMKAEMNTWPVGLTLQIVEPVFGFNDFLETEGGVDVCDMRPSAQ
jgi:hypothetical protein